MRKNIIQSKTEPNKNDIWLSEEGLKKYGKNGWEPLGGGGSNDSSLGNKILEIEVNVDNNFPEIKVKDYIDKIVIFKYPYNNAPLFRNYSIINVDSGGHIIEDYYILHYPSNEENTETTYIKVVYRPESLDENIEITLYEGNLLVYPFNPQGDGTKFLSNDGTYKEVSGASGPVIIEMTVGDEGIGTVTLNDEQINAAKNYNIRLKVNAPDGSMILVPYSYHMDGENIGFYIRIINPAGHINDSAFSIDVINKTITAIN